MPERSEITPVAPLSMSALDYELPESLIATCPAQPRSAARMMVVWIGDPTREPVHTTVDAIGQYLQPGDCLCFNTTSVVPARGVGVRSGSGGKVEGLYLSSDDDRTWQMMLKSNGRLRPGMELTLLPSAVDSGDSCSVTLVAKSDEGVWRVSVNDDRSSASILQQVGRTPLPPYIRRARVLRSEPGDTPDEAISDAQDRSWYETVYADSSLRGSVAAPTAGLHFTKELLAELQDGGVERCDVTLHVGAGTFKPVESATLNAHPMHAEWWQVEPERVGQLVQARADGRRIFAVGTTTVRTLESLPRPLAPVAEQLCGSTDLLIAPGFRFALVDGMLTNFHLPRSTLLALVAAKLGLDRTMSLYSLAVEREYRFYSYGDAMLLLP